MTKVTFGAKTAVEPQVSHATQLWAEDVNELRTAVNENDTTELSTSSTVVFDKLSGYTHGTWTIPITGDITLDFTGAQEGAVAVVIWRGATNPTFLGGTVQSLAGVISSDGVYSIYMNYLDGRLNVNIFNVDSPGVVTQFKIVTSGAPNDDSMIFETLDRISFPGGFDWSITIWAKSLEAVPSTRTILFGTLINSAERLSTGAIKFRMNSLTEWDANQVDTVGGVIRVDDTDDTDEHKYQWSWTTGDPSLKLSIDDIDFGHPNTLPESAAALTPVIFNLGRDATKHAWEFRKMICIANGVTHTFNMDEGSGATATSDTGLQINLSTLNAGGQTWIDSNMWQTV